MTWSWKLLRLAGIDVYVHATFLMLLAWIGFIHWRSGGMQAAATGVALIMVAEPYESLDGVLARIQESGCDLVPVLHQGRLVGIVTSENISELILLRGALEVRQARAQSIRPHYPRAA